MLALFPTGIVKCSALPLSTTIKQTQSTMLCFLHSAIWHRLFSVNLRGCNAADAGGNAVPTDSSKSAPTDSNTCYALSSVYCFLIFAKTHIGNPNERTHTYIHTIMRTNLLFIRADHWAVSQCLPAVHSGEKTLHPDQNRYKQFTPEVDTLTLILIIMLSTKQDIKLVPGSRDP